MWPRGLVVWACVSSEPHSRSKEWPVPRNLEHLVKSSGEIAFVGRTLLSSRNSQPGLAPLTSQKQPSLSPLLLGPVH